MTNTIEPKEIRATYSPEDNKLRFYPIERLNPEEFLLFKNMGFRWAGKQQLFVAPSWTPARYDFLLDYVGFVEPEETTIQERADQRAERFAVYEEKRRNEALEYKERAEEIAGGEIGNQVLIAHAKPDKAEREAAKLKRTMQKAVDKWETSQYWTRRTQGVIANSLYKDRADVRARRIKKLGAEMRKHERNKADNEQSLKLWSKKDLTHKQALTIAGYCTFGFSMPRKPDDSPALSHKPSAYDCLTEGRSNLFAPRTLQEVIEHALKIFPKGIEYQERWINHYKNRIAYETAVLTAQGGIDLLTPPKRPKQAPLINIDHPIEIKKLYSKESETLPVTHMTKAEYKKIYSKGTQKSLCGTYRQKTAVIKTDESQYSGDWHTVFLTDSKVHDMPENVK